jgi:polysaccharide biosynthesis protein PslH
MNILIVTPYLPCFTAGHATGVVLYALIRELSKYHKIYLATMISPDDHDKVAEISEFATVVCVEERFESNFTKTFKQKTQSKFLRIWLDLKICGYFFFNWVGCKLGFYSRLHPDTREFIRKLQICIDEIKPDILQIEYTHFCRMLVKRIKHEAMVGVAHDVEFKPIYRYYQRQPFGLKKIASYFRYRTILKTEYGAYKHLKRVYTVSDFDRRVLTEKYPDIPAKTRISTLYFPEGSLNSERNPNMILFVGAMYRQENVESVEFMLFNVLPKIWEIFPNAEFHVVGGGAPRFIEKYHDSNRVFIHGFQRDLAAFYSKAYIMVAPMLIGGGLIMKVIEAMHYGVPVVATSIANEGVEAIPSKEILIADTPEDFIRDMGRLFTDEMLHKKISENAFFFSQRKFNISSVVKDLTEDYEEILSQTKRL